MMWYVLCFLAGGFLGVLATALMVAARDEQERHKGGD